MAAAKARGWSRFVLMASAAALTLGAVDPAAAGPDPCTESGGVATCTGDQSDGVASGVDFSSSDTVLNVNGPSKKITPAADTNGILFSGDTTVEINSHTSWITINGYGDGVLGVAPGDVTINRRGDIYDAFRGINGHSLNGDVFINSRGDINNSTEAAINGYAPNGSVVIMHEDDIADAQNRGVSGIAAADSGTGTVSITTHSDISAYNQAIYGLSVGGTTINSWGNLYSEANRGISAQASGGPASIGSWGNVDSWDTSLYARSTGDASIESGGDLTSRGNNGAVAESTAGMASVVSDGDVWAANQGLFANGQTGASIDSNSAVTTGPGGNDALFAYTHHGLASVTSVGDVNAPNGRGVIAITDDGAASIVSTGAVMTKIDSVYAQGTNGASVTQNGDVSSDLANGLSAYGGSGSASVMGTGNVTAHVNGITANGGDTGASIDHSGAVNALGGHGVRAQANWGNATVMQDGDVSAETMAVVAYSYNGNASVTASGNMYSEGATAIEATVGSGAGNATIDSSGSVDGLVYGLMAVNNGTGDASVTHVGGVNSRTGTGGLAYADNGGNASIEVHGDTTAVNMGLQATALDGGNASIINRGDVTTQRNDGLHAYSQGGTASVDSVGAIYTNSYLATSPPYPVRGGRAIFVRGDGAASGTSQGDLTSLGQDAFVVQSANSTATLFSRGAISAFNQGLFAQGETGASIDSVGAVTAGNDAVFALGGSYGGPAANATVMSDGDVTSTSGRGVTAISYGGGGGDATVTSNGTVMSLVQGVTAYVINGDGNAEVTQTGDVTSRASTGIKAHADHSGNATVNSTGTVTAAVEAITAYVGHDGDATVNHTGGDVTSAPTPESSLPTGASGIVAHVGHDGNAKIVSDGTVLAETQGVSAIVIHDGNATAMHSGMVTSLSAFGIRADVLGNGDATVDSDGTVMAETDGVTARVGGNGNALAKYDGDVTSSGSTGIAALVGGTGNATVDAKGSVMSNLEALLAVANTGTATIKYDGTLNSSGAFGANAVTTDGSVVVDINGDVTSKLFGIQGIAGGNNRSVDITYGGGTINALSSRGISGEALGTGSTVKITSTGDINSLEMAAFANAWGHSEIDSTGTIMSSSGRGLTAMSSNADAVVTSDGDVTSSDNALFAMGETGATINNKQGTITATGADAIYAQTNGGGDVTITSRGDVNAPGARGIVAINSTASMGNVSIDTGDGAVTADDTAITAFTRHGNATVLSGGAVSSTVNQGIQAQSNGDGYAYVHSTGGVTSSTLGILALANSGTATVEQDGDVNTNHSGILALSQNSSATIMDSGAVTVRLEGLTAIGGTSASITHTGPGDVSSTTSVAVNAIANGDGSTASVNFSGGGNVTSYHNGIQALAFGTGGNASIMNTDSSDVTSTGEGFGLLAQAIGDQPTFTNTGGTAMIDWTGDVTSKFVAVQALSDGDASITYSGTATSTTNDAIDAQSNNGAVTIVSSGFASGARNGIFGLGDGLVSITHVGDATTSSNERAVHAQSMNGNVMVDVTGHIHVNGINGDSDAIFAYAPNGAANVIVRETSVVTGGTDPLASFGVEFGDGVGPNMLTNYGTIDDANGGKTIGGGSAADIVWNSGLVNGDFYLGGGANEFDNMAGGWTYFKAFSSVGAGNDFNNTGMVSPYGPMVIGSSVLEGNFNQSGTGQFLTDLDYGTGAADYLDVTGNVGAGGEVAAYITNFGTSAGPVAATIIHANGAVSDNGITGADQGPLMVNVSTTASTVDINVAVDFGVGGGLTDNSQVVGDYFQSQFAGAVPGGLTPDQENFYLALVNYGDTATYDNLLNGFYNVPVAYGAAVPLVANAANGFSDNLFSCRKPDGAYRFIAEGSCMWATAGGRSFNQDTGGVDVNDTAFTVAGGAQFTLNPNWVVGVAAGYENGSGDAPSVNFDREMFNAGIVAKGTYGNMQFAGAVTGGTGTIDSTRMVTFPFTATAKGDRSVSYVGLTGRASYVYEMGPGYLKPMIEGAATWVSADGFTETGAGIMNYTIGGSDTVVGRGSISLEVGRDIQSNGMVFRPFVSGGLTVLTGSDVDVEAGFPGLGPGSFTAKTVSDSVFADVHAGVYAFGGSGWSTRLEYNGRFSGNTQSHSATVKLAVPF